MPLEQTIRDARVGLRGLRRDLGFTLTAVVSLALGIAAATAMYSVVHAVILDPFPYRDIDSLYSILVRDPAQRSGRTYYTVDQYLEFRERATIFSGVIASTISDVVWMTQGEPRRLRGNHGPFDTFDVMGVPPLIGRAPAPSDARPGAPPVALLGYRFWQSQFGGDPSVLGRQMVLNGVSRQVIGIMPKRFMWRGADVYLPTHFQRGAAIEGVRFVHVLGRLKPGVTEAQAEAGLRPIVAHLKQLDPQAFPDQWRAGLLSFRETFPSGIRPALWILFGATGLLLLISCANVSNLLLSRAAGRQREMAVRASLGASRYRLLRQLFTESLVLALGAGALGVGLAYATLAAMIRIVPPNTIPDEAQITLNIPILFFSAGASVLTAILFGLAPAIHGCSPNLVQPLKSGARTAISTGGWAWLRNGLVVIEVALSLMLLSGSAHMLRTLFRLQDLDLGFPAGRVLTMRVPLAEARYPTPERRAAFFRDLLERVNSLPGVAVASTNTGLHPIGGWRVRVELPGGRQDTQGVGFHQVDPGYFNVFGFQLAAGRTLNAPEIAARRQVAVVNEAFAKRHFPDASALGATVRVPMLSGEPFLLPDTSFEIAGIVRDIPNQDPRQGILPEMFVPYTILARADYLIVRTALDPVALIKAVASEVYALDPEQPVMEPRTVDELMRLRVFSRPRFNLILFGVFATLGLILATVGVYGVISKSVAQRTPEIGLRMALGASLSNIAAMVLRGGLVLVGAGLLIGLAGTIAAGRLLSTQMADLAEFDPRAFAAISAILLAAGLLAAFWPARRASRIDPAVALRNE